MTVIDPKVAPAFLTLGNLSVEENATLRKLGSKLEGHATANVLKLAHYEAERVCRQFGISIPPSMRGVRTPVGWAGTAVDVIEERLDFRGWASPDEDDLGLSDIFTANSLDVDAPMAHLDALIYGPAFIAVGTGSDGEPHPLITMHSPTNTTGTWDARTRRLGSALIADKTTHTLYLPDQTIFIEKVGGAWIVTDRDQHGLGRVPIVQMENRARTGVPGRSEITKGMRYLIDAAMRTLLSMEVSREFYASPKLAALNVAEEQFQDEQGNPVGQWTAVLGRMWFAEPNEPGEAEPKLVHIPAASPAPYIDQMNEYAQLFAAEAGFPPYYLGINTANPPSADGWRASESRLVRRVERRQAQFGRAWMEIARLALLVRDGEIDPRVNQHSVRWRDAATPTRAADADAAMKLVSAGILPPDSQITMDRIGLSPAEQRILKGERRRARANELLTLLAGDEVTDGNANAATPPTPVGGE